MTTYADVIPEGYQPYSPSAPLLTTLTHRTKQYIKREMKRLKIYEIKIQCCVCKAWLGTKPTERADQHNEVSHTYCKPCQAVVMKEIEEMS